MNHNLEPLDVLDQHAERCMQACRVGCHSVESANDLLAECYSLIGALKAWKDEASVALKAAWLLERNGVISEGITATWDPDDRRQMEHWRRLLIGSIRSIQNGEKAKPDR